MILGHEKQLEKLRKIYELKKIPHALLFCGSSHLGKKTVAKEFISWFLQGKIDNHPDFILIEPETKGNIQIEQIRELNRKISLKPFVAKIKTAIIDSAEKMTIEAQNCFLKTLEEPAGESMIILISEFPHLILPTIVSRCQLFKFFPVENQKIAEYLKKIGKNNEKIRKIVKFAGGKPGVAINLFQDPQKFKEIENIFETMEELPKKGTFFRFQYVKDLLSRFNFLEILEILIRFFREKFFFTQNETYFKILKELQHVYFLALNFNLDQRLALENIFLKI